MRLLSLLSACGLALLSGCGTSSPPPLTNPPLKVNMTCASYNAGSSVGAVLAFTFDPVPVAAVALPVSGDGVERTVTCPAGQRVCAVAWPDLTALSQDSSSVFAVSKDVGHGPQAWSCQVDPNALLSQAAGTAVFEPGQVRVSLQPVAGAVLYRATLRGLGFATGAAPKELATASTTGTEVVLPFTGTAPGLAVVELEAWAMDPASPPAGAISQMAARRSMRAIPLATGPITLRQPSDFAGGTLDLHVAEGNRLAVILLNTTWTERIPVTILATGTEPYPAATPRLAAVDGVPRGPRCGAGQAHQPGPTARVRPETWLASLAAMAPAANRSFCVRRTDKTGTHVGFERRATRLARESATATFYLDDAASGDFTTADWDAVTAGWESSQAKVVAISGAPIDTDGNGKVTIVVTDAFCSGWDGYVSDLDFAPLDTSTCDDTTSNGGETIYLRSLSCHLGADGLPLPKDIAAHDLIRVLPHELQHVVDFGRSVAWSPSAGWDDWMAEGRAELMMDLAGLGLQDPSYRRFRAGVLTRGSSEGYDDLTLLHWQDWQLNYSAVGLLFRYLADRLGDPFIPALFHGEGTGLGLLEKASGLPFPLMYALWTSSLLFSNEPSSPGSLLDYTGADWTPLHQKFIPFQYAPLDPGTAVPLQLRATGFDVYVTGPAAGAGGGTVSVGSTAADKPYVVAIPFTGELPAPP